MGTRVWRRIWGQHQGARRGALVLAVPPCATPECTGLLVLLPAHVGEGPWEHLLQPQELEWWELKGALSARGWVSPWHRSGMSLGKEQCPPSGDGDAGLPQAGTEL